MLNPNKTGLFFALFFVIYKLLWLVYDGVYHLIIGGTGTTFAIYNILLLVVSGLVGYICGYLAAKIVPNII